MITTLAGPNNFLRSRQLSQLIHKFSQIHGDMAIEKIDGEEASFDDITSSLSSLSFLTPAKLVVLNSPSAQKQFAENINELLEAPADNTDIIIVEPKIDKRSNYFKILKSKTKYQEFNLWDSDKLSAWAVAYVAEEAGKLSLSDAKMLINRVGNNQQLLKNELDKLMLYNRDITPQTIELLTEAMPQSTIFELLDAAMNSRLRETERLYREQRLLNVQPQQIIAMLGWQLHVLAVIKSAGERSSEEIASQAAISPFVVRKSIPLVRNISFDQLKLLIADALELDRRLKTQTIDADEALLLYLLTIKK